MRVYRPEMIFIWEDDFVQRSQRFMFSMRVRPADGYHMLAFRRQFVPALQGFSQWTMGDKLREECVCYCASIFPLLQF